MSANVKTDHKTAQKGLQQTYAPQSICFGCGPANHQGLKINSVAQGDVVVADWTPAGHHEAFPGILNGGIIGALLDCHSNWTAAYSLMKSRGDSQPPCTVTADFHVTLKRPTPSQGPVHLEAKPAQIDGDRVIVEATLTSAGKLTATCRGTFVAVKEGHPAFHRW